VQLRNYMPKTLFGRMLAIILVPVILVQLITVLIFYERHWDSVTRQMAGALAGEITLIVDRAGTNLMPTELDQLRDYAARYFGFSLQFRADAEITENERDFTSYADLVFSESLDKRIAQRWSSDLTSDPELISVDVQLSNGVLRIYAGRKRIFSSTSWTFLAFTIGSSLLLFFISLLFLRGQVRPIRRLADAARQLGLGRTEIDYQLEGAKEVRLAGRAFQAMQHRIHRHLSERTTMLAGVSHDLRTPLTRMRLQTALLKDNPEIAALEEDIDDMQRMVDGYLSFARGESGETAIDTDLPELVANLVKRTSQSHPDRVTFIRNIEKIPHFAVRRQAIQRAFDNIIANALRYADRSEIRMRVQSADILIITFDDDGPGIPFAQREEAVRPFKRLEDSRNQETGGTGLGLAIASDIILSHGGELKLEDSPMGGLRVLIKLPI